jgi:hypothetical protein
MKSTTYNGEVRSSEKEFETLQLGAFATPGLLLAQGPLSLTAESGIMGSRPGHQLGEILSPPLQKARTIVYAIGAFK